MFDPAVIQQLANKHKRPLQEMAQIERELNERFVEFGDPVLALILAVISGEPLLLVGPPGTAKSRLIRAFSGMLGLLNEDHPERDHPEYFEYLLTPFTEPGELFGFFDIAQLLDPQSRKLTRDDKGMMQHATVVYLDEVFNASSAILNSLLAFLNERVFHDRGKRIKVANLKALFAATNDVPRTPELRAVFDRFVLRCWVDNVEPNASRISHLVKAGWKETYGIKEIAVANQQTSSTTTYRRNELLNDLESMREDIRRLTAANRLTPQTTHEIYDNLARYVKTARENGLSEMSNRRLIKISYIMLMHRVYFLANQERPPSKELSIGAQELQLIQLYFFDSFDPKDDTLRNNLRREARPR